MFQVGQIRLILVVGEHDVFDLGDYARWSDGTGSCGWELVQVAVVKYIIQTCTIRRYLTL
jgi:hypothetical protein